MRILNFGSCNIDYVYSLDHIVELGETEATQRLDVFPGGKGLNQTIAIARAGAMVFHAGCVGYDGGMLTDILENSGVDTSYICKSDEKNGHAIIQVSSDGDNSIFLYSGSNHLITRDYIDLVLENFGDGDIILLQNEINNLDYIVKKARQKGMCIILNPSPFDDKLSNIDFNDIEYIILNKIEAKAISGCAQINESLKCIKNKYPKLKVILTLGDKGCIYADGEHELFQSAFKVDVVDTTAAGDTFTGFFVAELSKGTDYQTILRIASAASAIAVSRKGAAPSIPEREEVLEALKSLTENTADHRSEDMLKQIDAYIDQNIKTANLSELAKILGYSTVYTGSYLRSLTGKTFSELVISKRCSIAARMLLETELPIQDIITAVGYQNESFFRKAFKKKYGKNPLKFRKTGVK